MKGLPITVTGPNGHGIIHVRVGGSIALVVRMVSERRSADCRV